MTQLLVSLVSCVVSSLISPSLRASKWASAGHAKRLQLHICTPTALCPDSKLKSSFGGSGGVFDRPGGGFNLHTTTRATNISIQIRARVYGHRPFACLLFYSLKHLSPYVYERRKIYYRELILSCPHLQLSWLILSCPHLQLSWLLPPPPPPPLPCMFCCCSSENIVKPCVL